VSKAGDVGRRTNKANFPIKIYPNKKHAVFTACFLFLLRNKKSNYGRLEFIMLEFEFILIFEFIMVEFEFILIFEFIEPEFIEPEFIEPEFIEPEFIEPEFIEPEFIEPEFIEPEFIESEFIEPEFDIIFEFIILLLLLELLLAVSPQAIPNALKANIPERAKVFFI
jgi:hypothetical protein